MLHTASHLYPLICLHHYTLHISENKIQHLGLEVCLLTLKILLHIPILKTKKNLQRQFGHVNLFSLVCYFQVIMVIFFGESSTDSWPLEEEERKKLHL